MNILNLAVIKCTLSTKGGYIIKLQAKGDKSVVSAFGTTVQKSQSTYYMKVQAPVAIGFAADIDLSNYKVTETPFTIPAAPATLQIGVEGQVGYQPSKPATAAEVVMLKWLFL